MGEVLRVVMWADLARVVQLNYTHEGRPHD